MQHDDSVPGDTGDSELERLRTALEQAERQRDEARGLLRDVIGRPTDSLDDYITRYQKQKDLRRRIIDHLRDTGE